MSNTFQEPLNSLKYMRNNRKSLFKLLKDAPAYTPHKDLRTLIQEIKSINESIIQFERHIMDLIIKTE